MGIAIEEQDGAVCIKLRIQPRASKNEITGPYGDALKIKITSPPVDGRANDTCLRFLAGELGVRAGDMTILSGLKGRSKRLKITGLDRAGLVKIFRSKGYD
ncbi:MAG: DUF167 domain-containing protein [Nitrospinota bacterium]